MNFDSIKELLTFSLVGGSILLIGTTIITIIFSSFTNNLIIRRIRNNHLWTLPFTITVLILSYIFNN